MIETIYALALVISVLGCRPPEVGEKGFIDSTPMEKPTLAPPRVLTQEIGESEPWRSDCEAGDPGQNNQLQTHQVYRATSTDGLTFTPDQTLLIDQASVPDGVVGPDGHLWVYYVNGNPGQHGIFAARAGDDGTFTMVDCVRIDGLFVGDAVDPDVTQLPGGRYRLFYFYGYFVRPPQAGLNAIHSAISDDGLNFTHEGVVFEYAGITDPTVVQLPSGDWLLAAARPQEHEVVLAHSDDGHQFDYAHTFSGLSIPELAIREDGSVHLFAGQHLVSLDEGQSWTNQPLPFVPGPDPSFVQLPDGQFVILYKKFAGDS